MKLSTNFTLNEFIQSSTAYNDNINEQYNPPQDIINNIKLLVTDVIQPIRDEYNDVIIINSGYRCNRLNNKLKGSNSSAHLSGLAADITTGNINNNKILFQLIIKLINENVISIDQLINEYDFSWLHIGIKSNKIDNRGQIFSIN